MSYRFVKITSYYRNFLEDYYSRKPGIVEESYDYQLKDILSEGFGWADFFKINLEKLGNEAYEIIWNAVMQRKWAEENGFPKLSGSDILYHQLKKIKPDIIFFQDSLSFPADFINKIRNEIPSVKLIMGWLCSPSSNVHLETFRFFDFSFGCSPEFVNYFIASGIKAYELNHAFEPSLLEKITTFRKTQDLIFIGSFIGSNDFHNQRIKLFEFLLENDVNVKLYTTIPDISSARLFAVRGGYILSSFLKKAGMKDLAMKIPLLNKTAVLKEYPEKLKLSSRFSRTVNPPVYGKQMLQKLSEGKIGLNIHGGVAGDYAANSRMFEVTGIGSVLVTDNKKNIRSFFNPDEEVITFSNAEECREKILWLLSHDEEMKRIGAAGQKRTLNEHTFLQRAEKLDEIIKKNI